MPERVKKTRGGGGLRKKFGGRYAGKGKEGKMRGVLRKKMEKGGGGMPERGKEDKMRWGGCEKNLRGRGVGYVGEGKEDKMRGMGVAQNFLRRRGVCRRG